jgi:phage shock protein PspC (stress-responsive transcriptional regulator)
MPSTQGNVGSLRSPTPNVPNRERPVRSPGDVPDRSPRDDSQWCAGRANGTLTAMETNDDDATPPPAGTPAGDSDPSEAPTSRSDASTGGAAHLSPDPGPRRLYKSSDDRMISGVCAGIAEYFGIDAVIVRVIAVALVFAGGAGLLAYVAAWLLVPERDADPDDRPGRTATIAGAIALVLAVCVATSFRGGPFGWGWSGPFVSLVFIGLAGLGIWYLASGEHPSTGSVRDILRRAGFGLALLAVSGILAIGGAWATAAGGGVVVAGVVIVAGLWLVAAAFVGGARWLILPALAIAVPAGMVSAANVSIDGGVGERQYRPVAAEQVRDTYRLGVGRLVVDMRDANLPAGDRHMNVDLGVGQAVLVVPRGVCVTTEARIGAGDVALFGRSSGGVDVDYENPRKALPDKTRLVIDGDIGVGELAITYEDPDDFQHRRFGERPEAGNAACIGGTRG